MEAVFNLSGVETGYANSLRRVIMADVPTICMSLSLGFPLLRVFPSLLALLLVDSISTGQLKVNMGTGYENWVYWMRGPKGQGDKTLIPGIDQVLFTQNTSPIPDEMLAHRLGMVPLVSQKVMDGLRYTRVSTSSLLPLDSVSLGTCPYLDKTD